MLRTERPGDMLPVFELVSAAFGRPDEAELVNRLRECGAAVVTMVEEEEYEFMGHLMLSPITINGLEGPWLGLAPVAVHPDWQGQGIGQRLLQNSIQALKQQGATAGLAHLWRESPNNSAVRYFSKAGGRLLQIHPNRWQHLSAEGYLCPRCGAVCCCSAAEMVLEF